MDTTIGTGRSRFVLTANHIDIFFIGSAGNNDLSCHGWWIFFDLSLMVKMELDGVKKSKVKQWLALVLAIGGRR